MWRHWFRDSGYCQGTTTYRQRRALWELLMLLRTLSWKQLVCKIIYFCSILIYCNKRTFRFCDIKVSTLINFSLTTYRTISFHKLEIHRNQFFFFNSKHTVTLGIYIYFPVTFNKWSLKRIYVISTNYLIIACVYHRCYHKLLAQYVILCLLGQAR